MQAQIARTKMAGDNTVGWSLDQLKIPPEKYMEGRDVTDVALEDDESMISNTLAGKPFITWDLQLGQVNNVGVCSRDMEGGGPGCSMGWGSKDRTWGSTGAMAHAVALPGQ